MSGLGRNSVVYSVTFVTAFSKGPMLVMKYRKVLFLTYDGVPVMDFGTDDIGSALLNFPRQRKAQTLDRSFANTFLSMPIETVAPKPYEILLGCIKGLKIFFFGKHVKKKHFR